MPFRLPGPMRSLGRAVLHEWHRFYDDSRYKWRGFRANRDVRKHAPVIVQDVHGIRFIVNPCDRHKLAYLVERTSDVTEFGVIPRLLRLGDNAFDIGANVGIYSVLLSRLCGPTGRVWSFEPVPETYWRLRETLALNRCDNVTPFQVAICERSGAVRMNLFAPEFSEWNTLGTPSMLTPGKGRITSKDSILVPSQTLDEFCSLHQIERINFLKVDVEGFEHAVFRGASGLLSERRVDYLCFEISQEPLRGAGIESRRVFQALEEHGYSAYRFDKKAGRFVGPIEDTLEVWTNFFASSRNLSKMAFVEDVGADQGGNFAGAAL